MIRILKLKNISIVISVIFSIVLVYFALFNNSSVKSVTDYNNVTIEDGIQIITVHSTSTGYTPSKTIAKANIPTILRMISDNAYGCERSFRIPELDIEQILPNSGTSDIELGTPETGRKIFGTCSMGMYTFDLIFE